MCLYLGFRKVVLVKIVSLGIFLVWGFFPGLGCWLVMFAVIVWCCWCFAVVFNVIWLLFCCDLWLVVGFLFDCLNYGFVLRLIVLCFAVGVISWIEGLFL